jgi:L-asparaginase
VRRVVVLATGGTIATRTDRSGTAVARASGWDLVGDLPLPPGVVVDVEDVFRVGSFAMTLEQLQKLARRVGEHLEDDVTGIVITHGTDTTEETAMFLDLVLDDPRPLVLTGAQRPADAPDSDGPRNLADAVAVAAHPVARGLGTLVVFDGVVLPARGIAKSQTLASAAFTASTGPIGSVRAGSVHVEANPRRRRGVPLRSVDLTRVRVDIAASYTGADGTALRAFAAAGARGIVLQGTGAGNANPAICETVAELTGRGLVVVTSTRVPAGAVVPIYGGGGGADLARAGALPAGLLRPPQARIVLAALLSAYDDVDAVRAAFTEFVDPMTTDPPD